MKTDGGVACNVVREADLAQHLLHVLSVIVVVALKVGHCFDLTVSMDSLKSPAGHWSSEITTEALFGQPVLCLSYQSLSNISTHRNSHRRNVKTS